MMQRMETYTLLRPVTETNELLERIKSWQEAGQVRAAISVASGQTLELNQLRRITSTHQALTPDAVQAGERLQAVSGATYAVDYAIPGSPYTQLSLTLTEELPHARDDR